MLSISFLLSILFRRRHNRALQSGASALDTDQWQQAHHLRPVQLAGQRRAQRSVKALSRIAPLLAERGAQPTKVGSMSRQGVQCLLEEPAVIFFDRLVRVPRAPPILGIDD